MNIFLDTRAKKWNIDNLVQDIDLSPDEYHSIHDIRNEQIVIEEDDEYHIQKYMKQQQILKSNDNERIQRLAETNELLEQGLNSAAADYCAKSTMENYVMYKYFDYLLQHNKNLQVNT